MSDDELLSVNDVARLWGTGLSAVIQSIELEQLMSLDRGLLVAEGKYDVPLIRRSWAEKLQREGPGLSRQLDPPEGEKFHPAVQAAFDFHKALDLRDAEGLSRVSSTESRRGRTPAELLDYWLAVGSHLVQANAGVGTAIFSLGPSEGSRGPRYCGCSSSSQGDHEGRSGCSDWSPPLGVGGGRLARRPTAIRAT